jgi:hypothetical protein
MGDGAEIWATDPDVVVATMKHRYVDAVLEEP